MNTELFIENNKVDITEDVVVPLTFAVAEIRDISKKRTSFSKTVRVPGTKNNNKLFGHYYDISAVTRPEGASGKNINVNFNQKKKADFLLLNNGASVLSGTVELRSVDITDGKITYNLVLFGELANLMSALGDKKLTQLTLPELTHNYTKENITGSWDRTTDYFYPLIDYGVVDTRAEAFTVQSLRPAVYIKYYWDKIFEEANFTYDSEFINSELFSQLILTYNKEGVTTSDTVDASALLTSTAVQRIGSATGSVIVTFPDNIYDTEENDDFGQWNETNAEFTSSAEQRVNIGATLSITNEYNYDETYTPAFGTPTDISHTSHINSLTLTHEDASGSIKDQYVDTVRVDSETVAIGAEFSDKPMTFQTNVQLSLDVGDVFYFTVDNINTTFQDQNFNSWPASVTSSFAVTATQLSIEGASAEGGEITQRAIVPADIKQKQFILNILRLFNLYMYEDPENPKQLIVQPRDDFYASGTTIDWTDKLDISRTSKVETLDSSKVRTLSYKYKDDDNDYYLERYRNKWDKAYGEQQINTGYELSTETKDVLELDFGTAVPIQYRNQRISGEVNIEIRTGSLDTVYVQAFGEESNAFDGNPDSTSDPSDSFPRFERAYIGRTVEILSQTYEITDLVSPWAFKVDRNVNTSSYSATPYNSALAVSNIPFFYNKSISKVIPSILKSGDDLLTTEQFVSVPRILRYSKTIDLLGGETYWIQDTPIETPTLNSGSYQTAVQTEYTYVSSSNKAVELSEYPFVSHVDDPSNPTFDLLFDEPEEVFWSISLT